VIGALVTPSLYRSATALAGPALALYLAVRRLRGKEDAARAGERRGIASRARPEGFLVWLHAASIGETLSILPVIEAMLRGRPALSVLITSGTVTSARLIAERLPERALHQYVPVDRPGAVRRFLAHWRPDLALWVESELWPNLVLDCAARGTPMLLINARLSARSLSGWRRLPGLIGPLLACFRAILAQSEADAARFQALGAPTARSVGNLKYDAPPLKAEPQALASLRAAIGARPFWLAASTHEGEEEAAIAAHRELAARHPALLTVIAPRHPRRAGAIEGLARAAGLALARRSRGENPGPEAALYLADTLGELGLLYALAPIVFLGGSLMPRGGHNLIEPARLGCALLAGPDRANFAELGIALTEAGALVTVVDGRSLAQAVARWFADPAAREAAARAAAAVASRFGGALERTLAVLEPHLPPRERDGALDRHARA
jgi:3-deoxy-D-manno-octulosonic-acid transferase